MGKHEKTVYTCDRFGKEIMSTPYNLSRLEYMRVLRWFVPLECRYVNTYLCDDCWKGLQKYLGGADHAD